MILTSSTSKQSVASFGMTGGFPLAPYACSGGMVNRHFSPTLIVSSAASQPAMSFPTPAFTTLLKIHVRETREARTRGKREESHAQWAAFAFLVERGIKWRVDALEAPRVVHFDSASFLQTNSHTRRVLLHPRSAHTRGKSCLLPFFRTRFWNSGFGTIAAGAATSSVAATASSSKGVPSASSSVLISSTTLRNKGLST
jgi:hypothetical protein